MSDLLVLEVFLSRLRTSSLTCVTTRSCCCSWGGWEGGFSAEEDQGPGEDLHHDPRGHLQLRLHRRLPLLLRDGRFGKPTRSLVLTHMPASEVLTQCCLVSQRSPRVMYFSSDQGDTFSQALLPSASNEQVRNRFKLLVYYDFSLIFVVLSNHSVGYDHKNKTQLVVFYFWVIVIIEL